MDVGVVNEFWVKPTLGARSPRCAFNTAGNAGGWWEDGMKEKQSAPIRAIRGPIPSWKTPHTPGRDGAHPHDSQN